MTQLLRKTAIVAALGLALPLTLEAATVFSDNFASSILNGPQNPPSANATDYAVLSSKNATGSSITAGSLDLTIPATSAGFAEMQALFSPGAITLGVGDYLLMTMTFRSTHVLDLNSGTQTINVGLYNSGGSAPIPDGLMTSSGMGSGTTYVNGYAQNWQGYVGRVGNPNGGNSSQIYTRDPQSKNTVENQDVLFNNSGTGAYDTPTGTSLSGAGAGSRINLTDGIDYTLTFRISYDGSLVTADENIFEGVGTGGANVYSLSGTQSGGYTTFDALAFGGRFSGSEPIHLTLSDLAITTSVVPEPSSAAVLLGGIALAGLFRRSRRQ